MLNTAVSNDDPSLQVKNVARDIYERYFRVAQATPRGVVAKLCSIVQRLEEACERQVTGVSHPALSTCERQVTGVSHPALSTCERQVTGVSHPALSTCERQVTGVSHPALSTCERQVTGVSHPALSACERQVTGVSNPVLSICERQVTGVSHPALSTCERQVTGVSHPGGLPVTSHATEDDWHEDMRSAFTELLKLLGNEHTMSAYELHSSGLVQALYSCLNVSDSQTQCQPTAQQRAGTGSVQLSQCK